MNKSLQPKVILITGCSSGFGFLTAARLAASGHYVFATMRDLSKKEALFEEVDRRHGKINLLPLDVTSQESIRSAVKSIAGQHGTIDVLVNNAGYGIGGAFEDLSDEDIRRQMDVNFFGVQNVTRQVIPLMRSRKSGRIINISSLAGIQASPCFGAYNASKWALEGFSESLRYELKSFGIDVLLVEPGTYRTPIFYANARYAQNFHNPSSPYYSLNQFLLKKVMTHLDRCRKNPENVATLVEELISAANPSFRNHPDFEAKAIYLLRKILPFGVYERMMKSFLLSGFKGSPSGR